MPKKPSPPAAVAIPLSDADLVAAYLFPDRASFDYLALSRYLDPPMFSAVFKSEAATDGVKHSVGRIRNTLQSIVGEMARVDRSKGIPINFVGQDRLLTREVLNCLRLIAQAKEHVSASDRLAAWDLLDENQ